MFILGLFVEQLLELKNESAVVEETVDVVDEEEGARRWPLPSPRF